MKNLSQGLLLATLLLAQPVLACSKNGKDGFLPENNLRLSVTDKGINTISEDEFNAALDQVEKMYAPIVAARGAKLEVIRLWDDPTVNAYAEQEGTTWKVSMFGGLARHKAINHDGMQLVICHEIGHHLGGAPLYYGDDWASNEGQADYFATLKCLRRTWAAEDNASIIHKMDVPAYLTATCNKNWKSAADRAICIRGGMAGTSVANLFADLEWTSVPQFNTPDTSEVAATNDEHPASQCRLDTYFQGALCSVPYTQDLTHDSEVTGACHATTGQTTGLRPRCWFKPLVE